MQDLLIETSSEAASLLGWAATHYFLRAAYPCRMTPAISEL